MKSAMLGFSLFALIAIAFAPASAGETGLSRPPQLGTSSSLPIHGVQGRQSLTPMLDWDQGYRHFPVRSSTFPDGGRIPQSMVFNMSGCTGGNVSPQLSWYGAPPQTQSFAVQMFDVDAGFTHWGMYNIPATTTNLPANAGVAGSPYGQQILNDNIDQHYDGPCPPAGQPHEYVITVFALDEPLNLPFVFFGAYPPLPETMLYGLLMDRRHILATGHITGFYSP